MARVEIKTNAQLQQMARAGVITSRALDAAVAAARPGVTTAEVNAAFERTMLELGGTSTFYGYYDYPATVCTSVNREVVHGIPGDYVLKAGGELCACFAPTFTDQHSTCRGAVPLAVWFGGGKRCAPPPRMRSSGSRGR